MAGNRPDAIRRLAHEFSRARDAAAPQENWLRAERELAVSHEYDTADRDLEQIGVQVSRLPLEAGVMWRLTLPRGERVETWTTGTEGLSLPSEITRLIGSVVAGKPLIPAAPLSDDPGAKRLRASLLAQRQALLEHDPGVRLANDPDNLRKHRVAARRTRAFLRATRRYVESGWLRSLAEPLNELGAATGPLRDLDVLLHHVRVSIDGLDAQDHTGGGSLVERLDRERANAYRRLVETLDSDSYRTILGLLRLPPRLAANIEAIPLDLIARNEFERLAKRVRRLGKHPDDAALHGLRIALKRARYAAELSTLTGKHRLRFLNDAKALQDLLGEHQDATVAVELLRATTVVDSPTAAAFVAGRLAERQGVRRSTITRQLPDAWKRLRRSANRLAEH
ncbi:MAG: CHAD domain-containing protein [Actinobacteria bacterium]|nr:CHAD domain-containing protein [Actinomycetota bacterium]